jgi:hypothetical protein
MPGGSRDWHGTHADGIVRAIHSAPDARKQSTIIRRICLRNGKNRPVASVTQNDEIVCAATLNRYLSYLLRTNDRKSVGPGFKSQSPYVRGCFSRSKLSSRRLLESTFIRRLWPGRAGRPPRYGSDLGPCTCPASWTRWCGPGASVTVTVPSDDGTSWSDSGVAMVGWSHARR